MIGMCAASTGAEGEFVLLKVIAEGNPVRKIFGAVRTFHATGDT
jgi:hypothetical protein